MLTPTPQTINDRDTFNIIASGTDFDNDVNFLDMTLTWDPAFLKLNTSDITISDDATALGFDEGSFTAEIDSSTLSVLNLLFDTPFDSPRVTAPSGIFDFFTLELETVSPTVSPTMASTTLVADIGLSGGWLDGSNGHLTVENYFDADITIINPVPVPAAVWLSGSSLLGLVGLARRSTKSGYYSAILSK